MRPLTATYRLQLRGDTDFEAARALLPTLRRLGVSHLYLSPVTCARTGSLHGYDGIDPRCVEPALGGEPGLRRLVRGLRREGLGLVLDIVPNHLSTDPAGEPFHDVLEHGPASRFACWFDIDWGARTGAAHAPLLLPVLGEPLRAAVRAGRVVLVPASEGPRIACAGCTYPLDVATLGPLLRPLGTALGSAADACARAALRELLCALRHLPARTATERGAQQERAERAAAVRGRLARLLEQSPQAAAALRAELGRTDARAQERLMRLLARQAYRLCLWRPGSRRLNYRRFFDVNDLIGLRQEDPEVRAASHAKILEMVERGWIDGLRIDHIDGLRDPRAYLVWLRRELRRRAARGARLPLLVEKILAHGERLPRGWPIEGTTGYEFLSAVEALLIDTAGARRLEGTWRRFTGIEHDWQKTARDAKRGVLERLLTADVRRLACRIASATPPAPKPRLTAEQIESAIVELIAHLGVYRTYADAHGRLRAEDRRRIGAALHDAGAGGRAPPVALALLSRLLLREPRPADAERVEVVARLEQLCGPAAAKGIEDTALYRYLPLPSLNEVGGEPVVREAAIAHLHADNRARARAHPRSLLAATTHDTKRSADVRARLDVLSEIPELWRAAVLRWHRDHRRHRTRVGRAWAPDRNTEWLLYQTLVGVWPLPDPVRRGSPPPEETLATLRPRIDTYLRKATREAKKHTSWLDPDPRFEQAVQRFVRMLLAPTSLAFLRDLNGIVAEVARPGLWNALTRTLLQLTAPGVPDLYQGDEVWQWSLVDPDNRTPVDFGGIRRLLASIERGYDLGGERRRRWLASLVARPEDGRLKLHVVRRTLALRRHRPGLFLQGEYRPLRPTGRARRHLIAFARQHQGRFAIVVAPRLSRTLLGDGLRAPVGDEVWQSTRIHVPRGLAGRELRSELCGSHVRLPRSATVVPVERLLARLPVGLWTA